MRQSTQLFAVAAACASLVGASPLRSSINAKAAVKRSLAKRDGAVSSVSCGLYATADASDMSQNNKNLQGDSDTVNIPRGECGRVACYNTSGIYVCNDADWDLDIPLNDIGQVSGWITSVCRDTDSIGGPADDSALSGRMYVDSLGGYNVNVGYCNNNHANLVSPASYDFPGPQGNPRIHCGLDGQSECDQMTCNLDSATVEDQESVVCGEWLGPAYIGPGALGTYSTTRTVGETWTVGGWLGFDTGDLMTAAVQAGFVATFAKTTTTGDTAGISQMCGEEGAEGNWTCAMDIAPKCVKTSGRCKTFEEGDLYYEAAWSLTAPQTKAEDEQGVYTANICTCPNCDDVDGDGAPSYICNLDCLTCNTPSEEEIASTDGERPLEAEDDEDLDELTETLSNNEIVGIPLPVEDGED